jgi:hypothetical protein
MAKSLDPVEKEYEKAMRYARSDEEAYELSIGLRQYREMFQLLSHEDWRLRNSK